MTLRLLSGLFRGEDRPRVMAELYFGDFRFDTRTLRLEGSDGVVEVRAKALELLTYLIEHRHRFVPRDELMRQLWPDVTVTDASLTQCVSELRQVLRDSSREPLYIETRIKKGYRFVAVVYHRPTERLEPLPPPPEVLGDSPRPARRPALWIAGVALIVVAGGLIGWWMTARNASRTVAIEVVHLASPDTDTSTAELISTVHETVRAHLATVDGIEIVRPTDSKDSTAAYQLEFAHATEATGAELSVILRSRARGEIRWGWTWFVPSDTGDRLRLPDEIAGRVLRSVTEELGLTAGTGPPNDLRRREAPADQDHG
jgi:DNA-binding winged helix-turn-helix (wHTH) protein